MSDIGAAIAWAWGWTLVWVFIIGAAVATFVILGVPWLWHFVKPWLHTITS